MGFARQVAWARYVGAAVRILRVVICMLLAVASGTGAPVGLPQVLSYQQGIEALGDQLPDLAVKRFRDALSQPELTVEARQEIGIRLAEALVRDAKPAEALVVLDQVDLAAAPEHAFWKGQALAGQGQLEAAANLLERAQAPGFPHATAACFSRASVLLALGRPLDALASLALITAVPNHPSHAEALLRQASIQFDLGKFAEARTLLSQISNPPGSVVVDAHYLDARLLLQEGRLAEAAAQFTDLLETVDPLNQSLQLRHRAALGLTDATAAAGDRQAAADALLVFIEKNPASPLLEQAFERLTKWMPANPQANDPILLRIRQWAAPEGISVDLLLNPGPNEGAVAAFPRASAPPRELTVHALFFLAEVMDGNPSAAASALRRLLLEFPDHPLTHTAVVDQANWMIKQSRADEAILLLGALEAAKSSTGMAAFVAARAEYLAGRYESAAMMFERASATFDRQKAHVAALDAAVSRMRSGDLSALAKPSDIQDSTLRADIELEQALYLASIGAPEAPPRVHSFLSEHPEHKRVAEARLALAAIALEGAPPDPALARAQLDHPDMEKMAVSLRGRAVLLRLKVEELARQWAAILPLAEEFLSQNPTSPDAPLVTLKLGEALFRNKDYNAARIKLQTLAAAIPDSPLAEVALFHSARAASLGGTPQAQEESLALYDQVIARGGALSEQAQVRKIRALIDLNRGEAAISFGRECLAKLPADRDDLRQPVSILLAEALFATGKGPNAAGRYEEAVAIYTTLLTSNDLPAALAHRLHYLRGLTLEQLDRDGEALDSYYQVLESRELGQQRSPEEWYQFERAAFKGLTLLEARGRWQAAVAFAEKIAGFQGPRAREAAERAKKIRLEHMIWE